MAYEQLIIFGVIKGIGLLESYIKRRQLREQREEDKDDALVREAFNRVKKYKESMDAKKFLEKERKKHQKAVVKEMRRSAVRSSQMSEWSKSQSRVKEEERWSIFREEVK